MAGATCGQPDRLRRPAPSRESFPGSMGELEKGLLVLGRCRFAKGLEIGEQHVLEEVVLLAPLGPEEGVDPAVLGVAEIVIEGAFGNTNPPQNLVEPGRGKALFSQRFYP